MDGDQVGRPERPLDPAAGPLQRFAFELRQLRLRAGAPSYRQLSKRAHYSATALSEAAGGERLPSLAVALAYVDACGGDRLDWEARWRAVAAELTSSGEETPGRAPAETQPEAPYLGLESFQPEDAERFFGREKLVSKLVRRISAARFLAVFGASGSGKSSLLRAGLLPAVGAGALPGDQKWAAVLLSPGAHPLEELAVRFALTGGVTPGLLHADLVTNPASLDLIVRRAVATGPATQVLLVVDQFEEVFTLCQDETERAAFIRALLAAASGPRSGARVVVGIRADFYGRCADYPALVAALQDAQVLMGAMSRDELGRAVTEPAAGAGLAVEPALVSTIVTEVEGRPGALPLLSHALLETWRRRRGRTLTLAGYEAAGGIRGAIAQTAERVYGQLSPEQQVTAKNVFLRLTALGEGTEDTRRRARRAELLVGPEHQSLQPVLDRLAQARLVTLGTDTVEVAHEAVIREWPRLRQWLTEDRDSLRMHRRLTEAATEWEASGRDDGCLYRGARLAAWQVRPMEALNLLELEFLNASHQREARERADQRRRTRLAVTGLSLALAVITALASLATLQWGKANDQRDLARSRELAASAAAQLPIDPELSLLLARAAYAVKPTAEAAAVLRQATLDSDLRATLLGHDGPVYGVAFAPGGRQLASAGADGTVRLWGLAGGRQSAVLRGHRGPVYAVTLAPDGQRVASAGDDGTVRIWDPAGRAPPLVLRGHTGPVFAVTFGPDGRRVASAGLDETVRIWELASGKQLRVLAGHHGPFYGVAFSPDGRRVATAGDDGAVQLWDLARPSRPLVVGRHDAPVESVAFSPDGRRLASASDDATVRVWDPAGKGQPVILRGHDRPVTAVAFRHDGQRLATSGNDGTTRIWDPAGRGQPVVLRRHHGPVYSVAFSPDGQRVASAGGDGAIRLWDPTGPGHPLTLRGHLAPVGGGIVISRDGRRLASGSDDGTIRIWDTAHGRQLTVLPSHQHEVYSVAFSPDGRRLASGGGDGTVRMWDLTSGADPIVLRGHNLSVFDVAFNYDGRLLASAGGDRTVRIWNLARPDRPVVLRGHEHPVNEVVFSPDGRVVSAGEDGTLRIWNLTRPSHPMVLRGHDGPVGGVAISPDGSRVASGGYDATVRIWDAATGGQLKMFRGHDAPINGVAFSPDGRQVASASGDATVRIWDPAGGGQLVVLRGHDGPVSGVAYTPDGQRLASASGDTTLRIWQCDACGPVADVLALAKQHSTRELTAEERQTFLHHP
jgi:WD40 repeat protein